jgi:hypothetical protein
LKYKWKRCAAIQFSYLNLFKRINLMILFTAVVLYMISDIARSEVVSKVVGKRDAYGNVMGNGGPPKLFGSWGYPGVAGPGGYPGVAGYGGYYPSWRHTQGRGYPGVPGNKAFSGIAGSKGYQGVAGSKGFSGVAGNKAFSGIAGSKGYPGIPGNPSYPGIPGD